MIEAYHFQGIMQKFPNHFHGYYVIGFIEKGKRYLSCKNKEYTIEPGDLLLFNPHDNHACEQIDGKTLDYRCINIQPDTMSKAVFEITGKMELPYFTPQVVFHSELVPLLHELHQNIMQEETDFKKEEIFFFLLEQLMEEYADQEVTAARAEQSAEARVICEYLEKHYMESIALDDLCKLTGLSKYYLLRIFTKQKGISPYSYLETIRIDKAKKLLEQGVPPIDAALQTGFSDQSHFSNFFKKFIGLTPKQYMNIFKDVGC
ncbi:AraC family transcriptional regulator [Lacrimispora amygdalina]|uniref:AraC family transcriptional regulator n=1 Tax=Lacrimispora amygdalina TaxID=253257 RepID=A0A3E2N3M7_9FIRM|nr:AraC family transcriptional regulator [Clostridium indicum]RFZ75610.1 AraC family transcriptional regulator [Clostridium indicum]